MNADAQTYKVLGCMSGSSLDGLDLALCNFGLKENNWVWTIEYAETINYNKSLKEKLRKAHILKSTDLIKLDRSNGSWKGKTIKQFI